MLTGYAAWRPQQLEYAVEKGVNVFMEKSFATDPPAVRRVIKAGEAAEKKNLKIAAGLMCRHSRNRQELIQRIRDGEMGEIQLIRAYRMEPVGPLGPRPQTEKDLFWQIRNFFRFLWVSGGLWAEMDIHQIDEILLDQGRLSRLGARHRRPGGQQHRLQPEPRFLLRRVDLRRRHQGLRRGPLPARTATTNSPLTSTARSARRSSRATSTPGTVHTTRTSESRRTTSLGRRRGKRSRPWQEEWNDLIDAIRNDRPHNEAKRAALSNLADMMGRAAVHSGKVITWERGHGIELPVVPEHRQHRREQFPADPGRRPGPLSRARARRVVGNLSSANSVLQHWPFAAQCKKEKGKKGKGKEELFERIVCLTLFAGHSHFSPFPFFLLTLNYIRLDSSSLLNCVYYTV